MLAYNRPQAKNALSRNLLAQVSKIFPGAKEDSVNSIQLTNNKLCFNWLLLCA